MTREEAIEKLHWFALDNRDKQIIDTAIEALTSQNLTEPNNACEVDLISRQDAIEAVCGECLREHCETECACEYLAARCALKDILSALPSAEAVQGWIPLNKQKSFLMMPDELVAVNVTWVNHNPPPYYKYTKDVPLVDSAVYYRGKWYWWDATVIDVLAEYGEDCNAEQIDKDIEILAWMPLPKPYREDGE